MKNNPIEMALEQEGFSETEKKAFMAIINHAKSCQASLSRDTLKAFINNMVTEVAKNENT